jgi:hypothetical protein
MKNYIEITKQILGDDIFDVIKKSEIGSGIFKPSANIAIDPSELKIAMQIVPRAVLSYLIANLKPMGIGGNIDLNLPFADAILHIDKIAKDVYSGDLSADGQKITEFSYRSLPGVGLILLSAFELYDIEDLEPKKVESKCDMAEVQKIIDERLSQQISIPKQETTLDFEEGEQKMCKKSKLKEFLEARERKKTEEVELDKSENISCQDCGSTLYKGEDSFKLCVCFGQFHNKNIKIKKNESGKFSFAFPKTFDIDNVELLIDTIKNNK